MNKKQKDAERQEEDNGIFREKVERIQGETIKDMFKKTINYNTIDKLDYETLKDLNRILKKAGY